jgi:hypothetical protein
MSISAAAKFWSPSMMMTRPWSAGGMCSLRVEPALQGRGARTYKRSAHINSINGGRHTTTITTHTPGRRALGAPQPLALRRRLPLRLVIIRVHEGYHLLHGRIARHGWTGPLSVRTPPAQSKSPTSLTRACHVMVRVGSRRGRWGPSWVEWIANVVQLASIDLSHRPSAQVQGLFCEAGGRG